MNKSQIFYVGLDKLEGRYCIYVSSTPLDGKGDSYHKCLNEVPLRKNHWRSAVKHYEKYNLYDNFYKAAIDDLWDRKSAVGGSLVETGLGNVSDWIAKNKDEIKELAQSFIKFYIDRDEKGDIKVIRYD